MLVGGAAVRPEVFPQPTAGATVRLVCTLSSPLPGAGLTVEWSGLCLGYLHTASLVVQLGWDLAYYPGWTRKVHRGGRGRLSSLCLRWSTSEEALQHWEGGRPVRGMDLQKHSTGCLLCASNFGDGNWFPLGFWLGDGRGRWRFPASLFPAKLSSVLQGSTTLPPIVL